MFDGGPYARQAAGPQSAGRENYRVLPALVDDAPCTDRRWNRFHPT